MEIKTTYIRIAKRMIVSTVILLVCLSATRVKAQSSASDEWAQARIDSIAVLLADRQSDAAVSLARSLVDSLESGGARGADMARGLEALARSLRRNRKYGKAETLEIARRAVTSCTGSPPASPDLKASCLNTLGLIHFQRSENEEALPLFVEATKLWSVSRGSSDQKVAASLNNQGLVLEAMGRNEEALIALEKAVGIYESRQDEPKYLIKFARTNMVMAKLHTKLGQYDQAGLRGEQSLEMYRSAPGGNHPRLGSAMGDLAALYRTMGDWEGSEALYESAIPLIEAAYGPDHSEVGR